jgi:hypothetical protein
MNSQYDMQDDDNDGEGDTGGTTPGFVLLLAHAFPQRLKQRKDRQTVLSLYQVAPSYFPGQRT